MIASLPMYDTVTTQAANTRLWALIRSRLDAERVELDRMTDPHETWDHPDLLLSQTCGLPFRMGLHQRVQLVGTPDYGVTGCPPGYYTSCIVVRSDDPRTDLRDFEGNRLARNDVRSQSGWAAIEGHLQEHGFDFDFQNRTIDTGAHRLSARAVMDGRADLASLDAVTWELIKREEPEAGQLRVLLTTRPTPGLPLITGMRQDLDRVFSAVSQAIDALDAQDREKLCLKGIVRIPKSAYLAEAIPAQI
jgi:ABC-type phosphate/phosphonate transport system substrate-binding protein